VSIEEVRALVAERQRYDEWLASLESKRADTPSRVFDRVYADYVGRRSDVITQLQSHVGELSAFGTELEQRLSDLETQLSANEEELAEGMLRNLVGEYDDDQWATVREAVEGRITTLGGRGCAHVAVQRACHAASLGPRDRGGRGYRGGLGGAGGLRSGRHARGRRRGRR
jgi:hypothetical protein